MNLPDSRDDIVIVNSLGHFNRVMKLSRRNSESNRTDNPDLRNFFRKYNIIIINRNNG